MKLIPLSATGRVHAGKYCAIVSDEDYDWLARHKWAVRVDRSGPNRLAYAYRSVWANGKNCNIRMHRAIWERHSGAVPAGIEVDHRDHGEYGGLDNRRENLRLAPHALNRGNSRKRTDNTSGFKGVCFNKRSDRWFAYIIVKGKQRRLGTFDGVLDAASAYNAAATAEWGEFARLNDIGERAA